MQTLEAAFSAYESKCAFNTKVNVLFKPTIALRAMPMVDNTLHTAVSCAMSATFQNMAACVRYSTATYVSLTTGDAFDVYGRSRDRKLSEKWVFPWFLRLKSAFFGHAG